MLLEGGGGMLVAQVLGGFSLSDAEGRDVAPRSEKACCLLAYLVLSGVTRERRERLAGLLWSESGGKQAFDSLRHCIADVRKAEKRAQLTFLHADRSTVALDQRWIETDRNLLGKALAARDMETCRKILARPDLTLLSGIEAGDAAFDNWLAVERERNAVALVQEMLSAVRDPAISTRDRSLLTAAIERIDPYQEESVRIHMTSLNADGDLTGAIAAFERYRALLQREFDVEPSETLSALHDDLLAQRKTANRHGHGKASLAPAPAAASNPAGLREPNPTVAVNFQTAQRIPTIVVMEGRFAEGASELRQLTEAFRHELMATLCRFKEWSVFPYANEPGETPPLRELIAHCAREAIDYALILSASAVAGATSIHSQLIECESSTVLISDQYPAASENWMAVVNDICCRIASRAQLTIAAARLRRVPGGSPQRNSAYDLWLEGETLSWMWTPENELRAKELFEKAVSIDTNLACAYGSWAAVLNSRWIVQPGLVETPQERAQALALAKRALALDPMDSRNHMHVGWCHLLARRFDPGELHFRLAYDLNPSNPDNLLACSLAEAYCGHHARARELSDRAFSLNPFRPGIYWGYRASIALLGRDFDECAKAVANAPDIFPDIQGWAAVAHAHRGDRQRAEEALEQFYADVRSHWQGPPAPTDEMLRRWFVEIFPVREAEDRRILADGMASFGVAQASPGRPTRATLRLEAR